MNTEELAKGRQVPYKLFGLTMDDQWAPHKLALAVSLLWAACWALMYYVGGALCFDWSERGQFGDMFGAVNALFSGLAFAGIIYTILLQREELRDQREELRLTRAEFEQQNDTLKKQRFENTFFNLLTFHKQVISGLTFSDVGTTETGAPVFFFAYNTFRGYAANKERLFKKNKGITTDQPLNQKDREALMSDATRTFFQKPGNNLYLYYQNLELILLFIYKTSLLNSDDQKMEYARWIKGQMSREERCLLFYHCVAGEGFGKLNFLCTFFRLIEVFDRSQLSHPDDEATFQGWKIKTVPPDI